MLALNAFAQVATTPAVSVNIPDTVMPAGIALFGEFNQLGQPRFTGGVAAIYPIIGSAGIYGTTVTDFAPRLTTDPVTGTKFYAFSAAVRQGFHKSLIATGTFTFLLGGDVGPSITEATSGLIAGKSSINVSFSTSATATMVWRFSQPVSFILPIRMLYVQGAGWNPVVEAGFVINLSKLPKAK